MKDAPHHQLLGKCKLKAQLDIIIYLSERLENIDQIYNVSKDVDKLDHSCIVVGMQNVKQYLATLENYLAIS